MRNEKQISTFSVFTSISQQLLILNLLAYSKAAPHPDQISQGPTSVLTSVSSSEDQTQCDCHWQYLKHYEAKGCTPVYGHDRCNCPIRFDCRSTFQEVTDDTACLVDGHRYRIGDAVNTSNNCEVCYCRINEHTNRASVSCVPIECPQAFSPRLPKGCYLIFEEGKCCPVGSRCANQTEPNEPVCRHDGNVYKLGQKIYPDEDPCLICLCTRTWTGLDGPDCRRHDCQLQRKLDLLRAGCIPIYHEETCCPIEYHCASELPTGVVNRTVSEYNGHFPEQCRLPAEFGTCQEAFSRYYFNQRQRQCEEFLFSGCGGNENRFLTRADCENTCGSGRNALEERKKPTEDQCVFSQRYYAIGEILDINHSTHCVTCTCSVPPDFTCIHRSCPPPPGGDYEHCTAEYKPGACCAQYECGPKKDLLGLTEHFSNTSMGVTCRSPQCDPGCRVDDRVPNGTCPGCMCGQVNQGKEGDGRRARETRKCVPIDPHCTQTPGCHVVLSSEGCTMCKCSEDGSACLPPNCYCPVDAKCLENGCRLYTNSSALGSCAVCMCSSGRALDHSPEDRVQCPSASKCPDGCQLMSTSTSGCPSCRCEPDDARPCLPPLCLCSPPHCESGCRVDRRVPLGRCPGCVCDLAKLDGAKHPGVDLRSQANRGSATQVNKGQGASGRECKPLHCESPCRPESSPEYGQCPSCICRFEDENQSVSYPSYAREGGDLTERRFKGHGEPQNRRDCPVIRCNGTSCKMITVDGKCPECSCTHEPTARNSPSSGYLNNQCPSAVCNGEGCRAVSGPDGCPKCECKQQSCPDAYEEERNCKDPCEWQDKPKKGGCPICLCPRNYQEGLPGRQTSPTHRKCPHTSTCEGLDCKLEPGPDGCSSCRCRQPECNHQQYCKAPCALQHTSNGKCPTCVCPQESYRG